MHRVLARRVLIFFVVLLAALLLVSACGRSPLENDDYVVGTGATAGKGGSGAKGGTSAGGVGGGIGGTSVGGAGVGGTSSGGVSGFGATGGGGIGGFGGSPGCGPCDGCCDAAGICRTGSETNACGKGGVACFDCGSIGFGCVGATCEGPPPPCGPATCGGCCDAQGVCRFGGESDACGVGGGVCANCLAQNLGCAGGKCEGTVPTCGPGTCSGCCDGGGQCLPGSTDSSCGASGKSCETCFSPEHCSQPGNYCAYIPTCGPLTCPNGCCDAKGDCQNGHSNGQCGINGVTCTDCSKSGLNCAPQGFCYSGPHCGGDNCAGCCDATGQCRPGANGQFCGQFGVVCDNCNAKNQTCVGQVCSNGSTCPAPYPGCAPGSATPPPATFKACDAGQLSSIGSACQGSGENPECGNAFQKLLSSDPACYDCLIQFSTDLAYARCLAPFLSQNCNHELTCALQCSTTACGTCSPTKQEQCQNDVFENNGECRSFINGYFCAQAALSGPAAFCDFQDGNVGNWIQNVGSFYCGGG